MSVFLHSCFFIVFSISGIFKQVAWAASGTAVGGIVGGPIGAMVGGVAGVAL